MDLRLHSNLARLERFHRLHILCILATTATQPSQTVIYNSEGNGTLHTLTSPLRARTVPSLGKRPRSSLPVAWSPPSPTPKSYCITASSVAHTAHSLGELSDEEAIPWKKILNRLFWQGRTTGIPLVRDMSDFLHRGLGGDG